MAVFEYAGYDRSGREKRGVLEAPDRRRAVEILKELSVLPVELREKSAEAVSSEYPGRVKKQDISSAFRQLAVFLDAGFPLVAALTAVTEQMDNRKLRAILADVKKRVSEGEHMSDAMGAYQRVFPPLYVNMVRAGESSGTLEKVMNSIAELTEKEVAFLGRIRSVMAYPLLAGAIGLAIVVFLLVVVLPSLTRIFADIGQALPLPTRVLIAAGDFFFGYWWALLLFIFSAAAGVSYAGTFEKGRMFLDTLKLKLPVAGELFWKSSTSRFSRTFATLLESGVPVLSALGTSAEVLGNRALAGAVGKMRENVREGDSITRPLRKENVFPPLALRFMAAGEESGDLNGMLLRVADIYDREVESRLSMLVSFLEPVMIVLMGLIVGFIVLAILLPVFEMSQVLR